MSARSQSRKTHALRHSLFHARSHKSQNQRLDVSIHRSAVIGDAVASNKSSLNGDAVASKNSSLNGDAVASKKSNLKSNLRSLNRKTTTVLTQRSVMIGVAVNKKNQARKKDALMTHSMTSSNKNAKITGMADANELIQTAVKTPKKTKMTLNMFEALKLLKLN
jgi:hypothetical protein